MRTSLSLALALLLPLPAVSGAALVAQAPAPIDADDRDAGWRSDLAWYVAEAQKEHADPARPAFGEPFTAAARALHDAIPELTDTEVLARLMQLAALLGDGHSAIMGPTPDTPLSFERGALPFRFYAFPSGIYIVDDHERWQQHAGKRVLRMGSVPIEQVMEKLSSYRGGDNDQSWNWMGPEFFLRLDRLIVDVRHNNGGNNTLVRPLVRTLIEWEMRDPGHRIDVLMGRGTFSACQNFINRVERWTDAVFFGEPTSSSPNFVGETHIVVLPYSRVRGSISNRLWQDSDPWDDRPWIEPDVRVVLTFEQYAAGIDPVLARALER